MYSLMWLVAMAAVWVVVSMDVTNLSLCLCREHAWPYKSTEILTIILSCSGPTSTKPTHRFTPQDLNSRANC